jgi:hypothetical protein
MAFKFDYGIYITFAGTIGCSIYIFSTAEEEQAFKVFLKSIVKIKKSYLQSQVSKKINSRGI